VRFAIPRNIQVVADAKRADIANTAQAYAKAIFNVLEFDAVTLNPYLGWDSLAPFLSYEGKCAFVLCKTSNVGAANMQEYVVDGEPLYMSVARQALQTLSSAEVGLVVGATQTDAITRVRALSDDLLLLLPGVGAQGADPGTTVRLGGNASGDNALISVSRDIVFASAGMDFAEAARESALRFASELSRSASMRAVDGTAVPVAGIPPTDEPGTAARAT
jgi:orotidine-5'-phosphate decarboxylase